MAEPQQNSILVVDDIPTNIKLLVDALNQSGFKISVAKSGESALAKVEDVSPDLILLDVMMPGINGFETCRRLKSNPTTRDIPIIFMTALMDTVDKVKGLELGAVDYITKPIQIEEVLARINIQLALRKAQIQLMNEVNERKQAEAKLQETLNELQQTQIQLIQSEKMSSLGQLAAGVAHEINNPVNFIYGNLSHIKNYTQDLLELIHLYQQCYPVPQPEIQARVEKVDLTFIVDDLPKILSSLNMGADRIRKIVLSLRNFSRLDEAEMKPADIHEGIDSTLLILQSRLKAKVGYPSIQVMKQYGELPMVECYAGQLNQVFMNIICNAIDAIEEKMYGKLHANGQSSSVSDAAQQAPALQIRTECIENNWVAIHISDNGMGVDKDKSLKLFDPFFTTKPVGKGTGLGLSISYQIVVEKHGGKLTCDSVLGEGTTFTIAIPVLQSSAMIREFSGCV